LLFAFCFLLFAFAFARNTLTHFVIHICHWMSCDSAITGGNDVLCDAARVLWAPLSRGSVAPRPCPRLFPPPRQGLTLVHLSPQPEPFLTNNSPNTPP
jgi:hypothetical protein